MFQILAFRQIFVNALAHPRKNNLAAAMAAIVNVYGYQHGIVMIAPTANLHPYLALHFKALQLGERCAQGFAEGGSNIVIVMIAPTANLHSYLALHFKALQLGERYAQGFAEGGSKKKP